MRIAGMIVTKHTSTSNAAGRFDMPQLRPGADGKLKGIPRSIKNGGPAISKANAMFVE